MSKCLLLLSLAAFNLSISSTFASQLVYTPTNPTFGGNALNGSFLLSTAQGQGEGAKSGQSQQPDLSGLTSALSGLSSSSVASPVVVIGSPAVPTTP